MSFLSRGLVLIVLALTVGITLYVILQSRAEAWRQARIAELGTRVSELRHTETLNVEEACAIAELHVLDVDHALAAPCTHPTFEPRGPRAGRLVGIVRTSDLDNVLFGGGFRTPLCLARSAAGWEVVGDDFRIPDCVMDVRDDAGDADEITREALAATETRRRNNALTTLDAVRRALANPAGAPLRCEVPLPATPLPTLSGETLAGRPNTGISRSFGHGMDGCSTPTPGGPVPDPLAPSCSLADVPPWILVFDDLVEVPPTTTGVDTYVGGTWQATLRVLDVAAGDVRCARPIRFALPPSVLTRRGGTVRDEYERGVKHAVCEALQELADPPVQIDAWWGC